MQGKTGRRTLSGRLALSLAAILCTASCSHTSPYVRTDILPAPTPAPIADELRSRIVLVGDAGEADAVVLGEVAAWSRRDPRNTLVVFLGDNMYPEGMTSRYRHEADARLGPQIEAATRTGAGVLFIPGNHDWADGGREGYRAILDQAAYVVERTSLDDSFLPSDGCPGPVAIDRFSGVRIVALDTQWWLHPHEKPADTCPDPTPEAIGDAFSRLLETDRHVLVTAHHPLFGYGRHAGFSDWKEHVRFPIVGSLIALTRKFPLRIQDYSSKPYRAMVAFYRSAVSRATPGTGLRIWAAGHEHNLQVLEGQIVDYVLISGSGARVTPVSHGGETLFAHSHPGFMVLEVMASGRVLLRVVEPAVGEVFATWLRERSR